ncbi:hypothetical protein FNF31_05886 [Cafeteria roenbergensis]|uniref:Pyrrolo-quinoline quinone repeat domain-containing protein n=1 Tax=Cafeteria roenbergensis TaxID=33653 RepID=A0A5A8CTY4_CAFRO|nr:hypothetical protein FNF31_05886 [Cafeteria roenbergensis]KAA0169976.1 hypothetical protein FNF28_01766 [Cafeteria roenbergensis]
MRCLAGVLVAIAATASAQLATRDWPQFGKSPSFQSYSTAGPSASPSHSEWTFNAGDRVVASPAVVGDMVYAGSDNGNIFALNATSGALLWAYATGGPVRSSPAVLADGSVIAGSYDGAVYHVSATGALLGKVQTGMSVYAPVSVANGTAYVGSMDKHLYAITIDGFSTKWSAQATNVVNSGTAVSADGSTVYFMDYSGIVHAASAADGSIAWTASTGPNGAGGSSPVLDNRGTLFIGSWSEHAFAFNATTGAQIWSFDTQGEVESHGAWVDGTVYFSAEESRTLFAINARTAQPLWQWSGSSQELNGSPTLTPTLVFVGSNDHSMHCLRRSDGKHLFAVQAAANVFASAAVADDGWVFFADNTATLDDIRAQNSDMMVAAERCAGDADCALAGARAVWSRSLDAERGSGRLGNVYAINPSLHL